MTGTKNKTGWYVTDGTRRRIRDLDAELGWMRLGRRYVHKASIAKASFAVILQDWAVAKYLPGTTVRHI